MREFHAMEESLRRVLRPNRNSRFALARCIALLGYRIILLAVMGAPVAARADAKADAAKNARPDNSNAARSAQISSVSYGGRAAFRLSDGRTEAIVVPAIGRVMRYGFVGGPNLLWNTPRTGFNADEWRNWGGDKTWPAPQSYWPIYSGRGWPPDEAWDNSSHTPQVLSGGRLRTTSPISRGLGARIVREYGFNARGEFEIAQILEKLRGAPMLLSLWNITQIAPPEAVFLPLNPQSVYKNNFFWFGGKANEKVGVTAISPSLLQVRPVRAATGSGNYKIGVDAPVAAIAAVSNGVAFVEKTARPDGQYPDGAESAGFPVELYDSGDADRRAHYIELELLSPLRAARAGTRWAHTVRWSLHRLASRDVNTPATHAEIERLLNAP